ncbi:thiol reductant ABC exporter subunit CydD [Cohnella fermenti]|uniref:Thiol reductant ABC exporter subunit CydD n=1 Tax=Cohnella fermenti TaxID=2565925 RepID=A0A4S4CF67_9BACL|nr:thiol reductant ABC exporter subunit CydD [Cohnella fermenti]THF84665.1 thiol reductant ABC exporter subunit CydD [Cohnella fermenti]
MVKGLFARVKGVRRLFAFSVLLSVASGIVLILECVWIADIADRAFLQGDGLRPLLPAFAALLGWIVLRAVLQSAGEYASSRMALGIKTDLRGRLLRKLTELGPVGAKEERSGELAGTAYEGVEQLETYLARYLPQMALSMFIPTAVFCVVAGLDALSAVVLAVTMPLLILFMILVGVTAKAKAEKQFQVLGRLGGHFLDIVRGLPTLRLFGRSRAQIGILSRISEDYRKTTMGTLRLAFLSAFVMELFATLSTAIVAVFLGLRLIEGEIGFEAAFLVLLLTPEFYAPVRSLGTQFHSSANGVSAAKRILALLDKEPAGWAEREDGRKLPASPYGYRIEFRGVSVRYPGAERDALTDVSFELAPGERLAIVGPTGSGKSTLLDLLQGYVKPTSGEIRVDEVPLGELSMAWWRRQLGAVGQHPRLFAGTVRDNVALGRPDASGEELGAAIRAAGAGFVGALPNGIETRLGEAVRLSGGQAQRLALARAFLMRAPIVLLDEPTSGLDLEREARLQQRLERLMEGRMTITVAHRLQMAENADRVLVIAEGRAVEFGHPGELARSGGLYAEMRQAACGEKAREVERARAANDVPVAEKAGAAEKADAAGEARRNPQADRSAAAAADREAEAEAEEAARETAQEAAQEAAEEEAQPAFTDIGADSLAHLAPTRTLRRVLAFVKPYKWRVALAAFLGFLTVAANVGLMGTSGYLIAKAALRPETVLLLWVPIVGVRFFGISRGVLRYVERLVSHDLTFRILHRVRVWLYERLEPKGAGLLEQRRSGDVLGAMVSDIEQLQNLYLKVLAPPLVAVLTGALGFAVMAAHDMRLALLLLGMMLAAGIGIPWLGSIGGRKHGMKLVRERARLYAETAELLLGLRELAAFGRTNDRLAELAEGQRRLAKLQREHLRIGAFTGGGMLAAAHLAMALVLLLSVHLAGEGAVAPVAIPALAMMALACFEAITPLPAAFQQLGETLASAERLFKLAEAGGEMVAEPSAEAAAAGDGERAAAAVAMPWKATVENLSFRYAEGEPEALRGVSLTLAQGKRIAVVGESGSGKTTLLRLLLGERPYKTGSIRLNGEELIGLPEEAIRSSFAVVTQHAQLFNASAAANIRLGRPDASDAEVREAARLALLGDTLERLPDGYDTVIGEWGSRLSGGERQRLALARALLMKTPAILFDEPATGLDPLTERAFIRGMNDALADRAVLWVTHRLTGLDRMDEIIVLHEGAIVERGVHRELLSARGYYYRLWQLERERDWREALERHGAGTQEEANRPRIGRGRHPA